MPRKSRPQVYMWTDGSIDKNPGGTAGFSAILVHEHGAGVEAGFEPDSTVNRAETLAVALGLNALTRPCDVFIHTDSQYVIHGLKRLARRSMLKTNEDCWEKVRTAMAPHKVEWVWVEGHNGNTYNEIADSYAYYASKCKGTLSERYPNAALLMSASTDKDRRKWVV